MKDNSTIHIKIGCKGERGRRAGWQRASCGYIDFLLQIEMRDGETAQIE